MALATAARCLGSFLMKLSENWRRSETPHSSPSPRFNLRIWNLCGSASTKVSVGGCADLSVSITSLAGTIVSGGKGFVIW